MSALILIVDDEQDLVSTLEYNLQSEGFRTISAFTGRAALNLAAADPPPDLILLDLMLPDMSGKQVCKTLRTTEATGQIPVIMLTAKDEEIDRVVGFELGADDYVTKPFSLRELMLRIKAVLRRASLGTEPESSTLRHGELRVDLAGHRVWVSEAEVDLTSLEFRLLTTLLSRQGRVQPRDVLLQDVWGVRSGITTRTVDTHIQRLRRKLGAAGAYVQTLRGVGYRFMRE